ncbi:MAG: ABC transporter ATP-binding protein, partial [Gemmatimonadaceae bacterium]
SFFSRKKTGSLITRVIADTDRIWDFIAMGIVDVSLSIVMLLGLGAVLLLLDWRLGLVMTVPVPLFCWLIYRHGEWLNARFIRAWRKWSRMTDVLGDTIPGIRVVKAFNQETREIGRFVEHNDDATDEINRIHERWTTFWPLLMLAVHATTVLVWALAVPRLLGGGHPLPTGVFVSFLLYTTMFVAPIEVIGQMVRTVHRATSSAHRVFEVLDSEPEVRDVPEPVRLTPVRGRVTFENVTFAYDGVRQVLRGVSFDVEPGELIGLVGASGGGKSTVVSLIARFYDATGGAVRVDGVDVRTLDTGHYREQLGMVLQDPYLFHGTVLENIRYGLPNASSGAVIAAARAANAHDFICKLGQGYDTVVGERGHTLSGGERQRISIARAILHDPRILILDEATSSVDTETEREIQQALERLIAGRTVFAIAHRLSTLRRASRLFVIEEGRLAESGTHRELLSKPDGIYRRLYELQLQLQ